MKIRQISQKTKSSKIGVLPTSTWQPGCRPGRPGGRSLLRQRQQLARPGHVPDHGAKGWTRAGAGSQSYAGWPGRGCSTEN